MQLSRDRAELIKKYFTDVWGIAAKRIDVKARNLPVDPSAVEKEEGQQENRRVEIASSIPEITAPIRRDETKYSTTVSSIRLIPEIDAPHGVDRWNVTIKQGARTLFSNEGAGTQPPKYGDWDIDGDMFRTDNPPVEMTLQVRDKKQQDATATETLTINTLSLERKREERIGDMRVNRSKLILFDFDKATISSRNRAIIEEVKANITPRSKVTILGFTDLVGDADHNIKLSNDRAEAVRKAFGDVLNNLDVTTKGLGSSELQFPNDTPEGRFYCRMVQVVISTPVE